MNEKFKGLEFGLQDFGQNLLDAVKMCAKHPVYTGFVLSFILSSCSAALPTAENPSFTPTIGPETNSDVSFEIIPTPNIKELLSPGVYPTESYCSDDLALCVFHQFDQDGKALAPRAYTNSKIDFDLDNNTVIVTGDPLIQDDKDVWIYPPHDGQNGYETVETMSVEKATTWMENMSEAGRGNMQTVIDEARSKGVGVNILMKTVLNVQKNADGQDKLVDMTGGLAISSGEEGATIAQLNDTLEPLTENELLKDQQIAGVDFVPQFDGTEKLVMEVYPSDWKDNGVAWVSPQWFELQSQIASAGEIFTLLADGTLEQRTSEGAVTVPGLTVDKNGVMTLQVGDQLVTLDPAEVKFDDTKGVSVKGYTQDENGDWGVESPTIALLNKYGVDPNTYTLTEVDGVMVGTDNETGKEILRDGRFEINYAVELAKKDCEPTDMVPDKWGSMPAKYGDISSRYLETLLNDTNYLSSDGALTVYNILIDRTKQCWGFVDGDALLYRDQTGLVQIVSTIHIPKNELFDFLFNQ